MYEVKTQISVILAPINKTGYANEKSVYPIQWDMIG